MNQPSQQPVPCISGAAGIDTNVLPFTDAPAIISPMESASSGAARPSIGNPSITKPRVMPPMSYITPLGMPVVPPV